MANLSERTIGLAHNLPYVLHEPHSSLENKTGLHRSLDVDSP